MSDTTVSAEIEAMVEKVAKQAREAGFDLSAATCEQKNRALSAMARLLKEGQAEILEENQKDLAKAPDYGLTGAMIDRLMLNVLRIDAMIRGLNEVVALPDPVGAVVETKTLENGLVLEKTRSPLGVVGIVFESRPNVTVEAASLCLKSGNVTILRGGKEAIHSNVALGAIVRAGLKEAGLPENCVQVIDQTDRAVVRALLKRDKEIDVIIPRGGHGLISTVVELSTIPVIRHDIGNCHVYVHEKADLKMAGDIAFNAKTHRPGVCNAMEHLLVDEKIAKEFLPDMIKRFMDAGVEIHGDKTVKGIEASVKEMPEDEWTQEYLDMIVGIKVVKNLDEAIRHINTYGSQHSDAIVTSEKQAGVLFQKKVDSAAVYVNASTRFTDGGQFGLGAEIGISTQKLHARGPMALEELTSVKWVVTGNGQIRT